MKQIINRLKYNFWRFSFPLSVISFGIISKWWYVIPTDGPDSVMNGFPLIYVSEGWHTSMSLQFFIIEFIIDFLCYILFWMTIVFSIQQLIQSSRKMKGVTIGLWTAAALTLAASAFILCRSENIFQIKKDFDVEVLETGFQFIWEDFERPKYYDYKPEPSE